jgi:hypothetical protein
VAGLLRGICAGDGRGWGAILGVVYGGLVAWFGRGACWRAVVAVAPITVVCQPPHCVCIRNGVVPVDVPGARCRGLLALGCGNATLDGEGGAVCARDAQGGGIAANLSGCYAPVLLTAGDAMITHFACMTCCEWWLAIVFRADRGASARKQRRYHRHAALILARSAGTRRTGETHFRMLC